MDSEEGDRRMHLIVDAHCGNLRLMTSRSRMRNWLVALAEKAKMHITDKPYIKGYPWPGGSDHDALTCFQPLMESGISVHCYPEKRFVFIDIFSCKKFDLGEVFGFIKTSMKTSREKIILMDRGIDDTGDATVPATVVLDMMLAKEKVNE